MGRSAATTKSGLYFLFLPYCLLAPRELRAVGERADLYDPLSLTSLFQVMAALAIVLALFMGVALFLKRISGVSMAGRGHLRILDSLSLGGKERIVLVAVGEEQLLLSATPARISTLHVLQKPVTEIAPDGAAGAGAPSRVAFRALLNLAADRKAPK